MRKKLGKLKNRSYTFTGRVEKVTKTNLLICDVKLLDGGYITNHIWVAMKQSMKNMRLRKGDMVRFKGVPGKYYKGEGAAIKDYHISQITNFQVTNRDINEALFLEMMWNQINDFEDGLFGEEEALFLLENQIETDSKVPEN